MVDNCGKRENLVVDSGPCQVPVDKHQQLVEKIMYKLILDINGISSFDYS